MYCLAAGVLLVLNDTLYNKSAEAGCLKYLSSLNFRFFTALLKKNKKIKKVEKTTQKSLKNKLRELKNP